MFPHLHLLGRKASLERLCSRGGVHVFPWLRLAHLPSEGAYGRVFQFDPGDHPPSVFSRIELDTGLMWSLLDE